MNKIVKPTPAETAKQVKPKKYVNGRAKKMLRKLNVFGYIEKEMLVSALPFILFLSVFALLYIANSYVAEKTIRDIDHVTKEIKELKSEYITSKSDLEYKSKQTQVAAAVLPLGIKETRVAPKKIVVDKKTNNNPD